MKHSESTLEELKRLPLYKIVKPRVQKLEKNGQEWVCCCVFHKDDSPSLTFYKAENGVWLYKCHGCGASGNGIQFVQKTDSCSFDDAVEKVKKELEWQAGKEIVESTFAPALNSDKKELKYPLSRFSQTESALLSSQSAMEWFTKRGIQIEMAKALHLGFLQSIRFISPNHQWADNGWISFPTIRGDQVTSIKYRSINGKKTEDGKSGILRQPDMSTSLYNLDSITGLDDCFIVEGEPDTLVMEQAGFATCGLPSAGYTPTPAERDVLIQANRIFLAGDMDSPGQAAMKKLWEEIRDRIYLLEWPPGCKDANDTFLKECHGDVDKFQALVEKLKIQALEKPMPFMHDLRHSIQSMDKTNPLDNPDRLRFPWASIDSWTPIIPGDIMALFATEALASGTLIPTPSGDMVPIGSIKEGDYVIGSDGTPTEVLSVIRHGVRPALKFNFWDDTSILCDEDHLWAINLRVTTKDGRYYQQVLTAKEVADKVNNNTSMYHIPLVQPVQFEENEVPLDPYIVGALLGDGSLSRKGVEFTSDSREIPDEINKRLPKGVEMHKTKAKYVYGVRKTIKRKRNPVVETLENLELMGKNSFTKFIPEIYKTSSVHHRLDMLAGLLDTDGHVVKRGSIRYVTVSDKLAKDITFLVQSLGGMVKTKRRTNTFTYKGKTKIGAIHNLLTVMMPEGINPFKMERKRKAYGDRQNFSLRRIVSVEPAGEADMVCLHVKAADGLFAAEHFVMTHNSKTGKTTFLMNILLHNAIKYGKVIVNYSAELMPAAYARRVVSYLVHKDRKDLTQADFDEAFVKLGDARYYNGYQPKANYKTVVDLLVAAKKRLGASVFVIDHIHFLTRGTKDENSALSEAMRMLKDFAFDYNVIVIVVGQPRKMANNQKAKEATAQDAKSSEAFGSDSSQVFILHRDRTSMAAEGEPIFSPVTKVKLDYSRESETKVTNLYFEGATCRFGEMEKTQEVKHEVHS